MRRNHRWDWDDWLLAVGLYGAALILAPVTAGAILLVFLL